MPLCEQDLDALRNAAERAREFADLIELRLDCLSIDPEGIEALTRKISCPLIVTFRPSAQGGHRDSSRDERLAFWKTITPTVNAAWCDIEGDLVHDLKLDWSRTILSHHDFSGVPSDLEGIYDRLAQSPAAVVKIAVQANDISDCIPVFNLLARARAQNREVIAIAMGNAGIATRVLGPSRGSFLTYGALDDESATAPGQVNAARLRSLYRVDGIDRETMICGLVGMPVMHSVSPHIHNAAFAAASVNGVYLPFEVKDAAQFFQRMVRPASRELNWNLRGLSVTAPHKQAVISQLDWTDPDATAIGAVNTVVIEGERLLGYNTDAAGFIEPLTTRIGALRDVRVAMIGAGGAARAAIWALQRQGAIVTLFARDVSRSQALAESYQIPCESVATASLGEYDVVVNATPVGSNSQIDQTPVTESQLNGVRWVYDLVYNPGETRLMREAGAAGCGILGGIEMLIAQAQRQFKLWTGTSATAEVMEKAVEFLRKKDHE